jgi:hypothetical protein
MIAGTPCDPLAAPVMQALFPLPILFSALRLSGRHEMQEPELGHPILTLSAGI